MFQEKAGQVLVLHFSNSSNVDEINFVLDTLRSGAHAGGEEEEQQPITLVREICFRRCNG